MEDIELRRNDEAFLDGLGAQRIPDPTTSGDFTRRFDQSSIIDLLDAVDAVRRPGLEKATARLPWPSLYRYRRPDRADLWRV